MSSRRAFLGAIGVAPIAVAAAFDRSRAASTAAMLQDLQGDGRSPAEVARDETVWRAVQAAFVVDRDLTNLNNGGVSPSPQLVHDKLKARLDVMNNAPPYHMWRVQAPGREGVRQRLARAFGADPEELAFTRNASESLMICQHGLDLQRGDEVLTTDQDYPRMLQAFRQRELRQGIVVRKIELPVPCADDDEAVRRFEAAITDRTKLILCCHVINLTGQVLPVARIAALGRARGIPVVVDGAHAVAQFPFRIDAIGCDFYGTSLHKWLFAPIGTGLLYVRRDRIGSVWPLFAATEELASDIRKFEEIGTHPAPLALGAAEALTFHEGLGAERKAARLCLLRDRWVQALREHERVALHTDLSPGRAYGIATVQLKGIDGVDLANHLWQRHRILVAAIVHPRCPGIRVSPSVYTTLEEVDRFVDAMREVAEHGLPA